MPQRISPTSILGISAMGAMQRNQGLANAATSGSVTGRLRENNPVLNSYQTLLGAIASGPRFPGTDVQGNVSTAVSGMTDVGINAVANIGQSIAHGALSGTTHSAYKSIGDNYLIALSDWTNTLFPTPLKMVQTFDSADAFSGYSNSIAGLLDYSTDIKFGSNNAGLTGVLPEDNNFGKYLGGAINNISDMISNGFTSLTTDPQQIGLVATDFKNTGILYDLEFKDYIGNPGLVISKIIEQNLGGLSGVYTALKTAKFDLKNVQEIYNSRYNNVLQKILDTITDENKISWVQEILGTNLKLKSLGDYCRFEVVFENCKDTATFSNFKNFIAKLKNLDLGGLVNLSSIAYYMETFDYPELGPIADDTSPVDITSLTQIKTQYLGGSGPYGAVLTSDMIGSMAGIGLVNPAIKYNETFARMNLNLSGITGAIDTLAAGITGIGEYNGALPGATTIGGYATMDQYIVAKVAAIELEITNAAAGITSEDLEILDTAWENLCKKISDEQAFCARTDMHFTGREDLPENALRFISGIGSRVCNPDRLAILQGMADAAIDAGDVHGRYFKAYYSDAKNSCEIGTSSVRWATKFEQDF